MAKSEILPEAHAGPMLRNDNPANVEDNPVSFFKESFAASLKAFFFFCAVAGFKQIMNPRSNTIKRSFFIRIYLSD
jgi:hypothetical protein